MKIGSTKDSGVNLAIIMQYVRDYVLNDWAIMAQPGCGLAGIPRDVEESKLILFSAIPGIDVYSCRSDAYSIHHSSLIRRYSMQCLSCIKGYFTLSTQQHSRYSTMTPS